jgi:hypothetical protein
VSRNRIAIRKGRCDQARVLVRAYPGDPRLAELAAAIGVVDQALKALPIPILVSDAHGRHVLAPDGTIEFPRELVRLIAAETAAVRVWRKVRRIADPPKPEPTGVPVAPSGEIVDDEIDPKGIW